MNNYECAIHQWPSGPDDTSWRCPGCTSDTAKPTKARASKTTTAYRGGSADVRMPGYTRMKRNERIRERDGYICQMCRRPTAKGEVDHIVALKDGGTEVDANCQLLCVECHKDKTAKDMGWKIRAGFDAAGMPAAGTHWNK
jgi:5-methylcytosine-specific restriction protein A